MIIFEKLAFIAGVITVALITLCIDALCVWVGWNSSFAEFTVLPEISFWQAVGIVILILPLKSRVTKDED